MVAVRLCFQSAMVRTGVVGQFLPSLHRHDMHIVAARLGCQSAMVGTRWANSCPGCMDMLLSPCRGSQGDMHVVQTA